MSECVLGLDIGGTNFRIGTVASDFTVTNLQIFSTEKIASQKNVPLAISETIHDYISSSCVKPKMIAIGFPSVVDKARRVLFSSTNFPGLDGVDIVDVLEKELNVPVIIDHDAYYLLAYDMQKNHIKDEGAVLGFYFGTGLGNALYIDGKAFYGKHGTACEIGHMPAGLGTEPCSCGNIGCVEMYNCGKRLLYVAENDLGGVPIGDVFTKCRNEKIMDDFVHYMAIPISTEINMLDPEAVCIGGGIVFMKDFPKDKLLKYIMANVRHPFPFEDTKIYFADNSPYNGIIGAAVVAYKKLEQMDKNL